MDEHFLHFIWKFQKFNDRDLRTTDNTAISVFHQGYHNHDSGPDFEEARILIGNVEWAGNVEIHLLSSDWHKHRHSENKAYNNVVLHVVWKHDQEIQIGGQPVPTLELQKIIDPDFVLEYQNHVSASSPIACQNQYEDHLKISYLSMIDKALVERLERKADLLLHALKKRNSDWEQIVFQSLMENFGFSTNKPAFQRLSESITFSVLKKNLDSILSVESILFGQAGFLEKPVDDYQSTLAEEYSYLKSKHRLQSGMLSHEWKFSKMRPANFPSLRIGQIASLLHQQSGFFSKVLEVGSYEDALNLLSFELNPYWSHHYNFGKTRKSPKHALGINSKESIVINTIAPILAAYAKYTRNDVFMEKATKILERMPAEANNITKKWRFLGGSAENAFESQGQIQLYKEYCDKRRCLSCAVGVSLLSG
ncbi:MAG: DUF2851 family protein [Bacteroidota bacterium]